MEEGNLVDEARGRAVAVSADAAATKRVEVRILIDLEEDGKPREEGVGKLMSRWRCRDEEGGLKCGKEDLILPKLEINDEKLMGKTRFTEWTER